MALLVAVTGGGPALLGQHDEVWRSDVPFHTKFEATAHLGANFANLLTLVSLVLVYPVDKWVLMMLKSTGSQNIRNLGDVRWLATEDGSRGKGTGRHIAAFILLPKTQDQLSLCD